VAEYRLLIELLGATSEPVMVVVVVGGGVDIMPDQPKFASYTPVYLVSYVGGTHRDCLVLASNAQGPEL
jgi:hypothetical protein